MPTVISEALVNAPLENFINLGMKQDMIFDFK